MRFHRVHGSALTLSEDKAAATKSENFCNAIAFSAQPVKINEKVCFEVSQTTEWSGALRIGVTSQDPGKLIAKDLPKYACPDLTNKSGFWARALTEAQASNGTRITIYVNQDGQMNYFVNNEHKGVLLNLLPVNTTLWLMLDVYGNTNAVKFTAPSEAPVEILARGPDAMLAYQSACQSGTQPVFRTRLMLVGQDRVGKTSLKKSLMGQRHDSSEQSTDGIDLSASCSFNLRDRKSWQIAIKDQEEICKQTTGDVSGNTAESIEEEYNQALATNIVQELLYKKRLKEKESAEKKQAEAKKSSISRPLSRNDKKRSPSGTPSTSSSLSHPTHSAIGSDHELLKEMPDRVVHLVQELWKEKLNGTEERGEGKMSVAVKNGKNIVLNIWDFAGQAVYYTTHQVFLSTRAVYVIVFNLCHNLDAIAKTKLSSSMEGSVDETEEEELTNLDYMDHWMSSIHAHTAQNTRNSVDNTTLSPPIFIVGTHRNSVGDDEESRVKLIESKFQHIRDHLVGKPYQRHVVNTYYAIENNMPDGQTDEQLVNLRHHIEDVASREPYMGEQMPIKWLRFEQSVAKLVEEKSFYVSLDQIREVASEASVTTDSELKTMLEFYHDLGGIVYYGGSTALDNTLRNTVILKPQWLIDMFKRVITVMAQNEQWAAYMDSWHRLARDGILEERLIDHLWRDVIDQKPALIGLMEKFDLICQCLPPKNVPEEGAESLPKVYLVPSRLKKCPQTDNLYSPGDQDVVFYLDFNGFFPDGLFHRLLTRASRWSQECGGIIPKLYYRKARFFLDSEHDFVLEMGPVRFSCMKVTVLRVAEIEDSDDTSIDTAGERTLPPPDPAACARVRNFLDCTLSDLRELWMKRISYKTVVECYCEKQTRERHFLNLDECLTKKIVCCEHRRVKTTLYRRWFPTPTPLVKDGPILPESLATDTGLADIHNLEVKKGSELPSWVKGAAKLLNGGSEGQDWTALAKRLGYKKSKIEKFNDDLNPGLALLTDWIISSGNTALSVDVLVTYLEQMMCDDIIDIIQKGQEDEVEPAQIFITYQWDIQDEVKSMRDKLEKAGFSCWMDIGQMGGGDQLHTKIDEGIRNSKVVIACVTPKYIVSHLCNRELSLADLLRKPIIPVMFEKVSWPPPGGMALMFSQLVYINMKEVGGHGGSGIHADLTDRYNEIIQQVSRYTSPRIPQTVLHSIKTGSGKSRQSQSTFGTETHYSTTPEPPGLIQDYLIGHVTPPRAVRTSRQTSGQGRANPVEQVHVQKCAICTIL